MKFGMRKPSLNKSMKARTVAQGSRKIKGAILPGYGRKGMGWLKNPKKATYNYIYHRTTFGIKNLCKLENNVTTQQFTKEQEFSELELIALNWLDIVRTSAEVVNTVIQPNFFFESYETLLNTLDKLIAIEEKISYETISPSEQLEKILKVKKETINNFIERYYKDTCQSVELLKTKEAKKRHIEKFYSNLEGFKNKMEKENIEYYTKLFHSMKQEMLLEFY